MEFIDSQRIYGNIFQLLDAAMAFLFKHLSLSGRIEGLEREEHLSVPYKAVREGVLNVWLTAVTGKPEALSASPYTMTVWK